ncbi:hypothetical protein [Desulfopila sp. IMCC35008]|uniref:hypothetical protein n=1 Tax=Desulfopila sp. IMCC35008 TaxID=2653858 RepID=UPI0013D007B7|nr:hypothetical protein [Desulfopila sp. IMCC35008]
MKISQQLFKDIFEGPVHSRLVYSRVIVQKIGPRLHENGQFHQMFRNLQHVAGDLNNHMGGMGLGSLCSHCASQPTGGCCSLFMSGETDAVQMALNSLAGVDVHLVCDKGQECVFLSDTGCIFLFKPMFCLNYNCKHIHEKKQAKDVQQMEQLTGRLLSLQYELEKYVLELLVTQDG